MMFHSHHNQNKHVLAIAIRLIKEHGEKFSIALLAKECGFSRATIYRKFGNRQEILEQAAAAQGLGCGEIGPPDTRSRILKTMRDLVRKTGTLNFSIDHLASEAGVGTATVYRIFGNRDQLLQEFALEHTASPFKTRLKTAQPDNMEADLVEFASAAIQFLQENHDIVKLYFSSDVDTRRILKNLNANQARTMTVLTNYLEQLMAAGVLARQPAADLAAAFFGMIIGVALLNAAPGKLHTLKPEVTAEFIVKMFLNDLRPITFENPPNRMTP